MAWLCLAWLGLHNAQDDIHRLFLPTPPPPVYLIIISAPHELHLFVETQPIRTWKICMVLSGGMGHYPDYYLLRREAIAVCRKNISFAVFFLFILSSWLQGAQVDLIHVTLIRKILQKGWKWWQHKLCALFRIPFLGHNVLVPGNIQHTITFAQYLLWD